MKSWANATRPPAGRCGTDRWRVRRPERGDYLNGDVAPVFFGSAINNFGVKEMLDTFIRIAPTPRNRETNKRAIAVNEDKFSGFVFKIHANLTQSTATVLLFCGCVPAGLSATSISTMCGWIKTFAFRRRIRLWHAKKQWWMMLTPGCGGLVRYGQL
jgi:hypothetical protein